VPELPDVEGFRRLLQSHVVAKTSPRSRSSIRVSFETARPRTSLIVSKGRRFGEPDRRGKWLLAPTDGATLLFHFGMTGSLIWDVSEGGSFQFERVVVWVGAGKLVFRDQRKLRGIWLADDEAGVRAVIGEQGPDAFGLSTQYLEERLAGRRAALKSVLMDQRVVSGLGNMLSDEVLWRAKIHPTRRFDDLQPSHCRELGSSLQRVLRASVRLGAIPRRSRGSLRNAPDPIRTAHAAVTGSRPAGSVAAPPIGVPPASLPSLEPTARCREWRAPHPSVLQITRWRRFGTP
jgi:formamidopyrimidine-DNA glycosylase